MCSSFATSALRQDFRSFSPRRQSWRAVPVSVLTGIEMVRWIFEVKLRLLAQCRTQRAVKLTLKASLTCPPDSPQFLGRLQPGSCGTSGAQSCRTKTAAAGGRPDGSRPSRLPLSTRMAARRCLISPRRKPSPSNASSKLTSAIKPPSARSRPALNAPPAYCALSPLPSLIRRLRPNQGKPSCSDKSP
jgi:hypothetical protein